MSKTQKAVSAVPKYKIERNIPIPVVGNRTKPGSAGVVDALRSLKINESVLFPQYASVSSIGGFLRNLTGQFTGRVSDKGLRVWRIK